MQFQGYHELPELTEKDFRNIEDEEWHKVRRSEHVQAMANLIQEGASVAPGALDGVVFEYEAPGGDNITENNYVLLSENGPEPRFSLISFCGHTIDGREMRELMQMDRAAALRARADRAPQALLQV